MSGTKKYLEINSFNPEISTPIYCTIDQENIGYLITREFRSVLLPILTVS